jgi:glycosyltransferase involved in cell wall biosynthesis
VYLYSPPNEDFGMGPVEAMAHGTPVVVWDDGAGPSETVIDQKTGFKARPYDLDDFAKKTLKILSEKKIRQDMGTYARKHVEEKFSWSRHMEVVENILYRCKH